MKSKSRASSPHLANGRQQTIVYGVPKFLQQSPVIALVLAGDKVIARMCDLLGPTDSKKAAKGTIRSDLSVEMMVNVCHASYSPKTAAAELKRFFKPEQLF